MRAQRIIVCFLLLMCGLWAWSVQFERNRDSWQQPEKVMDVIGVKPSMTIGEVGAGEGYFTFKLARRVGEAGRIYANDIDPRALKSIEGRCEREDIRNIITILGEVERPLLPDGGMDMVIMVYVLHDLAKPVELLRNILPALKPDAPLVVLERDPEKTGDHSGHFFSKERVLKIFDQAGYELIREETFLSRDNIFILRPRSGTSETEKL
jgi:ubiquinone/menaquinone biosynthesis C-methylase UbiE